MIGFGELRKQSLHRAISRVLHLVCNFNAVGILSAAEVDFRSAHNLAQQFPDAEL
jgi:hypothetical protein